MEPNQITLQHPTQNLLSDRQNPIDFRARERRVQEKPNLDIELLAQFLPQHSRQQHQMKVVDPDQITLFYVLGDYLCE